MEQELVRFIIQKAWNHLIRMMFFRGNTGLVQIENLNDSDRHLLLIKDSYANSMVQFLLPYYRTITIVDPRYFYEDIERIFNLNLITDVLFFV